MWNQLQIPFMMQATGSDAHLRDKGVFHKQDVIESFRLHYERIGTSLTFTWVCRTLSSLREGRGTNPTSGCGGSKASNTQPHETEILKDFYAPSHPRTNLGHIYVTCIRRTIPLFGTCSSVCAQRSTRAPPIRLIKTLVSNAFRSLTRKGEGAVGRIMLSVLAYSKIIYFFTSEQRVLTITSQL